MSPNPFQLFARPHIVRNWSDRLMLSLGVAALIAIVLEHGFNEPVLPLWVLRLVQLAAIGVFVVRRCGPLLVASSRREALREHWLDFTLIALGAIVILIQLGSGVDSLMAAGAIYVGAIQVFLIVRFVISFFEYQLFSSQDRIRPARAMMISYGTVILIGAVLLSLPRAMSYPVGDGYYLARHMLDCLFTATSATCVTGLVVLDTGHDFSLFGQAVILGLIQVGGLGTMIFGTVFGVLAGRQLSLRESVALQDALAQDSVAEIEKLVRFIVAGTFIIEGVGAILSYNMWHDVDGGLHRAFYAVFHSVSAFCNAGFALPSSNMMQYRGAWQVYGVIMPMIVLGGLGFPVLRELFDHAAFHIDEFRRRRTMNRRSSSERNAPRRWTLHTKITLTGTAGLIVFGAVVYFIIETPSTLQARYRRPPGGELIVPDIPDALNSLPPGQRALNSLFLSVTTRTAGFNTVRMDDEALSPPSQFFTCILMFIGGSPASTAGGAKISTLAILLLTVIATLRRRERIEAFKRSIQWQLIRTASAIVTLYAIIISAGVIVLSFTEAAPLPDVLFEVCSAAGTVGLSNGITDRLTEAGKVVIIAIMFVGRLGPLTLLVALAGEFRPARYEYPTERLIIG